ncbi:MULTISPECIES: hypothetical protein [Streptomyces]|uniref:PASTA domain-containing protein n=1 Tax=Streptomyces venezuelae (strain ATCC 10712 / CBS 650.69 / DSM 40230 / JCM 4526 / NBRC 13096 / PD 04745) TaxID=953739 RepID=F2RET2_STRVP|nr:hypothetical protein [Streptomyces venezuelae]APE25066.1 hypothetical protein vnz_31230 [Streptomyces venezuelae]QES02406.1 hypothetical protein DEJ43_31730 [Streptomyces venezuelae ATCC 10712]QES09394.1 hypothetical protein DEJ44_29685 [Streptomyces venezuelae]QES11950.1 hypothetical protein DEJ45_05785 [Streptomyces venezuelae]CCA59617.1 hypothetical protein SVEN_6331 [Streptomyces venezuelae ATCC 10712]
MRRRAVVGAGAVLALAAVAVSSTEETATAGEEAGTRPMPDFLGRGLWQVFTRLDRRTRLDVHDVSGRDRRVLWPPRWQVCTQYPAAGTGLDRRTTVMIGVVRKGETCPPRVRTARR